MKTSFWFGAVTLVSVVSSVAASAFAAPMERHRGFYRDRMVEYVERDGLAFTERDILLGTAADMAKSRDAAGGLKALIIDQAALLWPVGPSGAHEVPYVFVAGNQFNVEAAVVLFNAALRDTIRFVPRTSQKDYVAFDLTEAGSGGCFSYVGRIGGRQQIGGEPECSVGPLLHEMGHAIGFWHIMSDAAQGSYLNINYDSIDPTWRQQYVPELDARTVDGYDYASIMHYDPFVYSVSPDALTAATIPPGIDIGQTEGYSAADVDAVKRLYGQVPVAVKITTNPPGLKVSVDGVERVTPWVAWWRMGSLHRLDAPALQEYGLFKAAFGRWNHDPSASPKSFQEWIVEPGRGFASEPVTSPKTTVLTANFVRLVEVQSVVGGGTHGTLKVTPETAPWPGTVNFFPQFTRFDLTATPAAGYLTQWYTSPSFIPMTGGDGGTMKASRRIGSRSPTQIGAVFAKGPGIVLQTTGIGDEGTVQVGLTIPGYGDTFYAFNAPDALDFSSWPSGTYKAKAFERSRSPTVIFVPQSVSGVDDPTTNAVTMPTEGQETKVVKFAFQKQVYPLVDVNPECGGRVSLSGPEDYTPVGTSLSATATPAPGIVFAGWSGTVSGLTNKVTMTVDRVPELNADFNAIAEPLRLTRISPNAYALGQGPVTFELTGTGFTSKTLLRFADGRTKAAQLINTKTLRVTMTDADFLVAGKVVASVATPLSASCVVDSAQVVIEVAPNPAAKRVTVREFYNPTLDRYFVTADENEAKALQLNPYSLERQTGQTFQAWASTEYATGANVVYRFYGSVDPGPNGHFLTANVTEARALQRAELDTPSTSKRWNYEEMAFAIKTPQNGACPSDAPVKILRAYNNGFARGVDSNHRLLTDTTLYAQMLANGWIGEGVVMCGPV